jgi:hypothetical protein
MTAKLPDRASLPVESILTPRFDRVERGRLIESTDDWIEGLRAPRDLLHRFIRIVEAPKTRRVDEAKRIEVATVAFVSRYGMLGLCVHGLPAAHNRLCMRKRPVDSIDGYRQFALCLDALLRIGLELNAGRRGDHVDWELVNSILCGPDFPQPLDGRKRVLKPELVSVGRQYLGFTIHWLAKVCRIQPKFHWHEDAWVIDFTSEYGSGSNLPAILALQLMAEIGGNAMRKCRSCSRWFPPKGRQVYCRGCGIRAAWRDAKRRERSI